MEIRREGSKALSARFNFIFIFARQKKGSGFFFCAKHAPALRAAGAALRACNPAPPVAQPRHAAATAPFGPGPSLGSGLLLLHPCWHQAASPQGAPAPSWSHPFCCGLCFSQHLRETAPPPLFFTPCSSSPFLSPPKNKDLQTLPTLSCEALDVAPCHQLAQVFPGLSAAPFGFWRPFLAGFALPSRRPHPWLLWGWSFRPASCLPLSFSP